MSEYVDIPEYDKKDIKVNHINITHGSQINIMLTFKHRKECLEANQFLTEIINAMIDHSSLDNDLEE